MEGHFCVIPCFIDYFGRPLIDYALDSVFDSFLFILDNRMLCTVRVIDPAFFIFKVLDLSGDISVKILLKGNKFLSFLSFHFQYVAQIYPGSIIFSLNSTASLRGSKFLNSESDTGTTRIPEPP